MRKLPKINSRRYGGAGVYGWELGSIAFGDPMDLISVHDEKNRKAREEYRHQVQLEKERNAKRDYHKKYG